MSNNIIIYQTDDGQTKIDVAMENDTVWLSLDQMAELFQRDKSTISRHIKNIFEEAELDKNSTVANFATVQYEGEREVSRDITFYNLDVIISVGYRVKSLRGTQFRIWANTVLKEYLIKGFAMNDDILKKSGGGNYFDELLARIRDIRSSEKVFWRKILDIYATSIDYTANTEDTKLFFKTVQNKMHWAAHGHTAPELINLRANAELPFMGMTSYKGEKPTLADAKTAKNYLTEEELDTLNRIVSMYLDFAELQAQSKKPMYMKDWISKLDDFMKITDREILTHAGKVSHELAEKKAKAEYQKYNDIHKNDLSKVERDFIEVIESANKKLTDKGVKK